MNTINATGVATLLGFQEDGNGGGFNLWNLVRDIPGHPAGSTIAQATLEAAIGATASAIFAPPEVAA